MVLLAHCLLEPPVHLENSASTFQVWSNVCDLAQQFSTLCALLEQLSQVLGPLGPDADVRPHTAEVTKAVQDAWERVSAAAAAAAAEKLLSSDIAPPDLSTDAEVHTAAVTTGLESVGRKGVIPVTAILLDSNEIDITA